MTPLHHPLARAAGLYAVLGVALTWPLGLHLGTGVPNDPGDSLLNVFLLAWNARELPLTERWWDLPQFYPARGAMAFSEHLLGLSILSTPAIVVTGNPLLGYNVAFLLSFPLCGLAAHALAFQLTRRHDVAVLAGVAFAFAPYRMSQLAHVQVLSSYWMPLALLGLHRFLEDRRGRWLLLFAGAWYVQALACGYYLFYLSVLVGVWIVWFATGRMGRRDLLRLAAAWLAAILALVPFARGYLHYLEVYGFVRGREEIESFSADLASVLSAPGNLVVWGGLNVFSRPEAALFPGVTILLVITCGAVLAWRRVGKQPRGSLRAPWVVAAMAATCLVVAVTPIWLGPWRIEVGGARLLSVGTAGKPLLVGVLLGTFALALHPAGRAAWHRRSPLAFYAGAAVLMWALCLGPAPTLLGQPLFEPSAAAQYTPYAWLMMFPGVDGVRVPARFWTLATLCLAAAGSVATVHALAQWPRLRLIIPATAAALVVLEGWPAGVRIWSAPSSRPALTAPGVARSAAPADGRRSPAAVARLELPMGPAHDVVALYRAADHRLPVFNGYSGYFAPHYSVLMGLVAGRDPHVLERLASVGPIEVLVDHASDPAGAWRSFVADHPRAQVVVDAADHTLYLIPSAASSRGITAPPGGPLAVVNIHATVHPEDVELMTDGDLETRWHTGPQAPDNEVVVDLGAKRPVEVVELQLGGFSADFPRHLVLALSADGTAWTEVWSGPTATHALWAAIEGPRTLPLRFPAGGAEARYVRLRQTGEDPIYYWSIAELTVYGGTP